MFYQTCLHYCKDTNCCHPRAAAFGWQLSTRTWQLNKVALNIFCSSLFRLPCTHNSCLNPSLPHSSRLAYLSSCLSSPSFPPHFPSFPINVFCYICLPLPLSHSLFLLSCLHLYLPVLWVFLWKGKDSLTASPLCLWVNPHPRLSICR